MSMTLALAAAAVLIILPAVASEIISFKTCDGAPNNIEKVDISPCSTNPCKFLHNITATVTIWFSSPLNTNSLTTKIFGIVAGVPVPFANPHPDACKGDDVTCPLQNGQSYKYVNSLYVNPSYPSMKLVVQWRLTGDKDAIVVCFNFPMEIDSGVQTAPIATVLRQKLTLADLDETPDVSDKLEAPRKTLDGSAPTFMKIPLSGEEEEEEEREKQAPAA